METITPEERRLKKAEYLRNYRKTHKIDRAYSDLKQRLKPEYHEREMARMKRSYEKKREFNQFRKAIPAFLTV